LLESETGSYQTLDIFFDEKHNQRSCLELLEIYARIGSSNAKSYLVSHLDYPNRDVQLSVMWALYFCRYQADSKDMTVDSQKYSKKIVENILWLYASWVNDMTTGREKHLKAIYGLGSRKRENHLWAVVSSVKFYCMNHALSIWLERIYWKIPFLPLKLSQFHIHRKLSNILYLVWWYISQSKAKKLNSVFPQEKKQFQERLSRLLPGIIIRMIPGR